MSLQLGVPAQNERPSWDSMLQDVSVTSIDILKISPNWQAAYWHIVWCLRLAFGLFCRLHCIIGKLVKAWVRICSWSFVTGAIDACSVCIIPKANFRITLLLIHAIRDFLWYRTHPNLYVQISDFALDKKFLQHLPALDVQAVPKGFGWNWLLLKQSTWHGSLINEVFQSFAESKTAKEPLDGENEFQELQGWQIEIMYAIKLSSLTILR